MDLILNAFVRAIPWFVPGALTGAVVAAVVAPRVARHLRASTFSVWAFMTSTAAFLALTITPVIGGFGTHGATHFGLGIRVPSPAQLLSVSSESMNLLAGVGLGVTAAWLGRSTGRMWPVVTAASLPFGAEIVQWLVPGLGRVGFSLTDAAINDFGVLIGALAGLATLAVFAGPGRLRTRTQE